MKVKKRKDGIMTIKEKGHSYHFLKLKHIDGSGCRHFYVYNAVEDCMLEFIFTAESSLEDLAFIYFPDADTKYALCIQEAGILGHLKRKVAKGHFHVVHGEDLEMMDSIVAAKLILKEEEMRKLVLG